MVGFRLCHMTATGLVGTSLIAAGIAAAQTPPGARTDRIEPPAAHLDTAHLPATPQSETLLHVTQPGRFAIAAHSASGTALDVVDMITGPTERQGEPGATDGRLDLLLDTGTYKLRT